jgi:hypothetical protein
MPVLYQLSSIKKYEEKSRTFLSSVMFGSWISSADFLGDIMLQQPVKLCFVSIDFSIACSTY